MTKTTILDTVIYENEKLVEERIPHVDRESNDENSLSSLDSDENSSKDEIDANTEHNHVSCGNCGKVFTSLYHHERYLLSKECMKKEQNMIAEARALRILREKIDNEELIIRKLNSNITHVAPPPISNYWSDEYFGLGWALRPRYCKTKGHTYITDKHKEMIRTFFKLGEEDKGKKTSAALMVEAMKLEIEIGGTHSRQKHYVLNISEIKPLIGLLSSTRNKK